MQREKASARTKHTPYFAAGLKFGLLTFLLLASYFLLMTRLGYLLPVELRYANLLFLIAGIMLAIRTLSFSPIPVLRNRQILATGLTLAIVSGTVFSVFLYLFFLWWRPDLGQSLLMDLNSTLFSLETSVTVIFFEALISGYLVSFLIARWMR
ncbi:hypothetical protein [Pontibacter sp. G13]|uniref:hypothetical protein n=1 Tax=Pontibacter sp. G13 TaxID=3074898 RepID=UPI00288C3621|nr:hypothetical protein [Pontibacter sp. G13]WNJ17644.1 hypothetical protein RJD25_22565 [Pontibacter sp. G13]